MAETPTPTATHTENPFVAVNEIMALLQFMYHNPVNDSNEPFPSGIPVNIIYVDSDGDDEEDSHNPFQIGDDGHLRFTMEHRDNLYFEFEFDDPIYINMTDGTYITEDARVEGFSNGSINTHEKMIFRLPQRFNLQDSRWIVGEEGSPPAVYDADRRMFVDLQVNMLQGDGSGYLPVILNPEWQYIGFQYFDRHTKSLEIVPQFPYIRGLNEEIDGDDPATSSTVYKDNCICLPWIEDRNTKENRNNERIVLKFNTRETFIESGQGLKHKTRDEVRAMPLADRLKFYDLPEEWSSKNWYAKAGINGTAEPFVNLVNDEPDPSSPIVFELDSIVITDDDAEWESDWDRNNRFTVFDLKMKIVKPDTNKPYLTDGNIDSNFFPMGTTIDESDDGSGGIVGHYPRLISLNGDFYDVTDKRSTGDLIGARAAVLDDEQVHYGDDVTRPVHTIAGNFELHYLKDCLDSSNNAVSALLIYWSCKFECDTGATNGDLTNFHRSGMTNAKARWDEKGYMLKSQSDANKKVITVFFFEGREDDPYKCSVTLHAAGSARSSMGVSSANFMSDDYQEDASSGSNDFDGTSWCWFTMSHEIGHAMGLLDEYLESLEEDNSTNVTDNTLWNPPLPQFDQYYPGMPYSCDWITMMLSNRSPRLRHLWYFARWVNETDEVKALTDNNAFMVHHSGNNFNYSLSEEYKNFYEPAHSEEDFENGDYGEFDLFLYKIGNDETTKRLITGQSDFNGILVVRHKIQWFFEDNAPASWATINAKLMYLRDFHTTISHHMNNKYYLECAADSEFSKVYVYFLPYYQFESGSTSEHFEVTVKANSGATVNVQPDFFEDGFDDDEFAVDALQNFISIYGYMLGLVPYQGNPRQVITAIGVGDLGFLARWIGEQRSQTYQLRT
jgi:hypothetical protein